LIDVDANVVLDFALPLANSPAMSTDLPVTENDAGYCEADRVPKGEEIFIALSNPSMQI